MQICRAFHFLAGGGLGFTTNNIMYVTGLLP